MKAIKCAIVISVIILILSIGGIVTTYFFIDAGILQQIIIGLSTGLFSGSFITLFTNLVAEYKTKKQKCLEMYFSTLQYEINKYKNIDAFITEEPLDLIKKYMYEEYCNSMNIKIISQLPKSSQLKGLLCHKAKII